MDPKALVNQYRDELLNNVMPFWLENPGKNYPPKPRKLVKTSVNQNSVLTL